MAGALAGRFRWRRFRRRFNNLRLRPILDYTGYRRQDADGAHEPAVFRFTGAFESVTDGQTLWIHGDNLTIPVSLENAETYLLPAQKNEDAGDASSPNDEAPERIRWERVSALTVGAKVFIGGLLACRDGRWSFISTKENPLMVIFYDGPDQSLAALVARAGRNRGDYWNFITPYSIVLGIISLVVIASMFIYRPAFRLTVIVSCIALFVPLYPFIPPGLLCTFMYRRLFWLSRLQRIKSSLVLQPPGSLADGEKMPDRASAGQFTAMACILETLAWLVLLAGITINIVCICIILGLF